MPITVQASALRNARRGLGSVAATAGTTMVTATIESRISFSILLPQEGKSQNVGEERHPLARRLPRQGPAEPCPPHSQRQARALVHGQRRTQLALQELVPGFRAGRGSRAGGEREASQRTRCH